MNKAELIQKFPQFFSTEGKILPNTPRNVKEALTQLILETKKLTLISFATRYSKVKCTVCEREFTALDIGLAKCPGAALTDLHPRATNNRIPVLYLWKIRGTDTYKFGRTGTDQGRARIDACAKANNVVPELLVYKETPDAERLELEIKNYLSEYRTKHFTGDGYREMFDLTPGVLEDVIFLINES